MKQLFLLEDDMSLISGLSFAVKKQGYEIDVARTTLEADTLWENGKYDLAILDVSLPDGSGFDFCKKIRSTSKVPIMFLTAADEETDIIMGLDIGGDDYITKPFSLPVLKARIDNVFSRRIKKVDELTFENLSLDLISKQASIDGIDLDLNLKEFAILEMLLENQNINLLRERILDYVWGYDFYEVNDNTLTVTIKRLRSKLGDYGSHIKTLRGIGYRWDNE